MDHLYDVSTQVKGLIRVSTRLNIAEKLGSAGTSAEPVRPSSGHNQTCIRPLEAETRPSRSGVAAGALPCGQTLHLDLLQTNPARTHDR